MGDELEQQLAGKTLDDIRHALPCSHPIQIELDKLEQANKELAEYKCGVEVADAADAADAAARDAAEAEVLFAAWAAAEAAAMDAWYAAAEQDM